jgi:phenylpropionate dioxygenase-like ring-hydroxylating dioxygenase large terminal subunit
MAATVLTDGTRLGDLIDEGERTIRARVHTDPEIFELELERIFARAWIPVAHVTELREPGDFVTRQIGRDPVIVSLGSDGELRVLLNICTHRGMRVCRAELGNQRRITCPFHGWAFGSDGRLRGVPFELAIYGEGLDKDRLGLRQARVAVCAGIVFATWDEAAPALAEFIGDFSWYLEAGLCRSDAGLEVAGPPQRYVVEANWKMLAEGFHGDASHVLSVHNRSFADIGLHPPGDDGALHGLKASSMGHSVLCIDLEQLGLGAEAAELLRMVPPTGMSPEQLDQLADNLAPGQVELLARTPPIITALFPASAIVMILGGPAGATSSLRFFTPLSPTRTEISSFTLLERQAPEELRAGLRRSTAGTFGSAGIFEADDVEVWEGVQEGISGPIGRSMAMNYQAVREPTEPGPAQPGTTFRGVSGDDNQWLFYQRWLEYLEAGT